MAFCAICGRDHAPGPCVTFASDHLCVDLGHRAKGPRSTFRNRLLASERRHESALSLAILVVLGLGSVSVTLMLILGVLLGFGC